MNIHVLRPLNIMLPLATIEMHVARVPSLNVGHYWYLYCLICEYHGLTGYLG